MRGVPEERDAVVGAVRVFHRGDHVQHAAIDETAFACFQFELLIGETDIHRAALHKTELHLRVPVPVRPMTRVPGEFGLIERERKLIGSVRSFVLLVRTDRKVRYLHASR